MLDCLSQQVLHQHVTTTKQNREELFFSCKNKQGSLLLPHWLATEGKDSDLKSVSDSSLLYICSVEVGYLHPLGHKGMQSHFLPSVRVAAPRDEPNLSTLARFLRSDFLESKETPTKSRDTGLPSSLQLLLFQLSVTSTLQTLSEKDTGRGSFQHHYLSASRYCSKLP